DASRTRTLLKVIILGDSGMCSCLALTSTRLRYVNKKFSNQNYTMKTAPSSLYRFVLYQVNYFLSFDSSLTRLSITPKWQRYGTRLDLNNWREEFLIQASPSDLENFPFIVISNKSIRVVSQKKARAWCASKGKIPYYGTSAKEATNVEDTFMCITKDAMKSGEEEEMYLPDTIGRGQQDVNAKK
ncbi:hypothetical protein HID58_018393, partial [Brassica napus]